MAIHILDFPDNVYIMIDDKFRNYLFKKAIKNIGSLKMLAKELEVSITTIRNWKNGKNSKTPIRCPVKALKKLVKIVGVSVQKIEKHILFYKTQVGTPIFRPKLPIKESESLGRIVGHLFADGSYKKRGSSNYTNFSNEARKDFIKIIRNTFGEVYLTEAFNKKSPCIYFPKVISIVIKNYYKIESFNTHESFLSSKIKNSPKSFKIGLLKAFIIDEGNVRDSCIKITLSNLKLLKDLKRICKEFCYKCGKIFRNDKSTYGFLILSESLLKFKSDMKTLIILHKNKALNFAIRRQRRTWNHRKPFETKRLIIKYLFENTKTVKELSYEVNISSSMIRKHLYELYDKNLIQIVGKNKNSLIWCKK